MVDQALAVQEASTVEAVALTAVRMRGGSPEAVAAKLRSGATELQASAQWLPLVSEVSVALSATAVPTPIQ